MFHPNLSIDRYGNREYEDMSWLLAIDGSVLDEDDVAFIETLQYIPPNTDLTPGQVCELLEPTNAQRLRGRGISKLWQVRFVISAWTYGAYKAALGLRQAGNWDNALAFAKGDIYTMLRDHNPIPPQHHRKAMVYAHSFPHGIHPDSASWFHGKHLVPFTVQTTTEGWPMILDSAGAPYAGIESPMKLHLDFAPDHYRRGSAIGRPFAFEEPAVQTMALLGYEEAMMRPVDPRTHHVPYR